MLILKQIFLHVLKDGNIYLQFVLCELLNLLSFAAKLASWRWRSRFGRPSMHKLGADPTGTYCKIPDGWLKEKAGDFNFICTNCTQYFGLCICWFPM